ncbi:DUF6777 domain-containing protein [Kitasatospora aureofaciens]|uniref:DUF6777 domain-containing protein n=1 Tax=Kitasatospora aureofaciens TaxID=1894 RepID=UPI001E038263|nr:DUF6777 domain-containing protein [Kitasatospora aureofaciens]HJD82760.1 hypothetical protein [Kitasatospora aureofaciens]
MAAAVVVAAVVATVLIVSNQGGKNEAVPTANEVALQAPADPGPAPFTPSVETQGMSAPAPTPSTSAPAQPGSPANGSPTAVLHSVQGSAAGLYGGTMSRPSCDTERLIGMVSSGDTGRAWASAAGIEQSAIPSYLRSLTSAYLRVDTRVTNHSYKSGAVVEFQSVLQAGTAVLVDAQGVPRVRCACGNPLKPPTLVSNAKYTGKAWTGFEPSTLIVVVPAPQPVPEIVLVNVETGGWFARLTGRADVVDKRVDQPRGPLVPGIPPPAPWKPTGPAATASASGRTSSRSGSPTTSGATSSGATPSRATSSGAGSSAATSSGATSSGATASGATSSGATSSRPPTGTGSASATSSTSSTRPSESTATTSTSSGSTSTSSSTSTTGSTLTQPPSSRTTTSTGPTSTTTAGTSAPTTTEGTP